MGILGNKTKKSECGKTFLSDVVGWDSSVSWNVALISREDGKKDLVDAEITIRDCYKIITLDCGNYGEANRDQVFSKVNTLIAELNKFLEAYDRVTGDKK